MAWELSAFGTWAQVFAGLMLSGVFCGIWYFTVRRPASSDVKVFTSYLLFFIPTLTLQDAAGDASPVFAGVPLLPLQGIEFSAAVYARAFVLTQWRSRLKGRRSPRPEPQRNESLLAGRGRGGASSDE